MRAQGAVLRAQGAVLCVRVHRGRFYVRTGDGSMCAQGTDVHGGRLYGFSPSALRRPLRRVSNAHRGRFYVRTGDKSTAG